MQHNGISLNIAEDTPFSHYLFFLLALTWAVVKQSRRRERIMSGYFYRY
jgi:hypothetical protein